MRMARQTISSAISTISIHSKSFQAKTKTKAKKRPEDCDSPSKKKRTTKNLAGNKSWDQPRFRAQIKYNKRLKDTLRKNLWRPPLQEAEECQERERDRESEGGRDPKLNDSSFFFCCYLKFSEGSAPCTATSQNVSVGSMNPQQFRRAAYLFGCLLIAPRSPHLLPPWGFFLSRRRFAFNARRLRRLMTPPNLQNSNK